MSRNSVIEGLSFRKHANAIADESALVQIANRGELFQLTYDQLTRHLLAIGNSGFGKTVALLQIAEQLREKASPNDVFIFFDTKGDYLQRLRRPTDAVISYNTDEANVFWNIYADILADGVQDEQLYDNAYEISTMLYQGKIQRSPNPFFPNAARDIMMGLLFSFAKQGVEDSSFREQLLHNQALAEFFRTKFTVANIVRELRQYDLTESIIPNIAGGQTDNTMNPQSQGVISEASAVGREILKGAFAQKGKFSVRKFIRSKGAKALFVEYDMRRGNTLLPIYRTLCDIALKEAMSRNTNASGGRVYIFMDELKLLPNLQYLENAINFGRGMGVSIIAGLQSSSQLQETYGEHAARSIMDSFGTAMVFNTSNAETRKTVAGRIGKQVRIDDVVTGRRIEEKERISDVLEDWHITCLDKGYCIVHSIGDEPYLYKFPNR